MTRLPADPPISLAERKRRLVRDEMAAVALKLFAGQGFEATTIDKIAELAGVSRRTFFRYFESKEDVIIAFLDEFGVQLCAELATRPVVEQPGVALRATLGTFVDSFVAHPEKSLVLARLMIDTPALRARYLDRQDRWRACLTYELARRTGDDPQADMRPALTVAVALVAFDTALIRWIRGEGRPSLAALVDEAFALTTDALGPSS